MHAMAIIHQKEEYLETYVKTWYTKQTQLAIYLNFIKPVKGPKQLESVLDMLRKLPFTLRRPPSKPTTVKRHKVGVHNQVVAPTQQKAAPTHQKTAQAHQQFAAPREKLPLKRKPTTLRWMPSTQESSVSDLSMTL
ncbi:hypothetical protein PVK06_030266 [Gossypium arboreum]|uniref:Uncharacterized protein n=1 Tax=Gossypium arboreum TaxID=29729 RepID=A0ABR0NNA7_GOSAR|nr:hypothetical protein PVK06_030266 [Gossypium arboreum]